jgi:serine/threonine-protein kinase
VRCPSCGRAHAEDVRFCGDCGAALPQSEAAPTMTSPAPLPARPPSAPPAGAARFLPGQVLAGRYRMIGPLGRGGMGEVYRADDLKLGQPVALKFLPRDVERNPDRLARFLTEVRLSLRVTHPNVCRVFDLGDVDGRYFISMEYVDGEDLASLLRRIGRLPEDKAIEIARQLGAGLAAAHEEGVLHRDLKPANVMIDGRGRAKITDFGLAGATSGIAGVEARAGTPQYMAPEQFDGRALSIQTDLYSLGLVLYELFTGKRAFDRPDLQGLAAARSSTPTSPSAHVSGLDPAVERAILRCLDPDPARRPHSAASLAAALPGGDPLAMAIAAGETPSPDMVAGSGGRGELRPAIAAAALAIVLVGLVGIWIVEGRIALPNRIRLPKPPEELRVAARAVLATAGYTNAPASHVHGFQRDTQYFSDVARTDPSPDRWSRLASVEPAPIWYWYRESPQAMTPAAEIGTLGPQNPPMNQAGMARIRLDPSGRLQELYVVPHTRIDPGDGRSEPDWALLFAAAGFRMEEWQLADAEWMPPRAFDVRRAWTRGALRIESAALNGQAVWFRVVPPWRRASSDEPLPESAAQQAVTWAMQGIMVLVVGGGALLARRNLRQQRGDRRGAARLAAAYLLIGAVHELLRLSGAPVSWFAVFTRNLAIQLYWALLVWIFYIAIEPYVRRLWPRTLVAWTRAIDGRVRDPLVGRHLLLGALAGLGFTLLFWLPTMASALAGVPPDPPVGGLEALASFRLRAASCLAVLQEAFVIPVGLLLSVLILRVIFRRPAVAYAALFLVGGITLALGPQGWPSTVSGILTLVLSTIILTRLGLFAFLVAIVFSSWPPLSLTADPSSWFFPSSVATMLLFAGIAAYGFVVSLGGQKIFTDSLLGEDRPAVAHQAR